MKKFILLGLLGFLFTLVYQESSSAQNPDDIDAAKSFPLRRLNYMFSRYVVPTIFNDKPGMFIQTIPFGEGQPIDGGALWYGFRSVQGYNISESGITYSAVVDFYKTHDYGRDSRFEGNFAYGMGYNTKSFGIHIGVFSQVILGAPNHSLSQNLKLGGPEIIMSRENSTSGNLDWYAYYKLTDLAKFRAIYRTKGNNNDTPAQRKAGLETFGMNFMDVVDFDYYRNEKLVIADFHTSTIIKKYIESYSELASKYEIHARFGYKTKQRNLSEYAFGFNTIHNTFDYGVDVFKTKMTPGKIGLMTSYTFLEPDDEMPAQFRIIGFYNYHTLVLETYSKLAVFAEFRLAF